MGLTGRECGYYALSSQEEPQLKYNYKFRLEAKDPTPFDDETSKSEVQAYINELLGLKGNSREKVSLPV
jgi:hypothetical protein